MDDISSDSTTDNGLDSIFGSLFGDSTDQMFSEMNQKLQNGEQISFSELFKNYSPLQLDSSSLFDMSDMGSLFDSSNNDMSITNLKYAVAASDMETTYAESVLSEYNKRKDWLSDKNSSIKQNTRKYQLQQKLAVSDADQSIIEAKKKTGRKQTENEVREEERKKGIVNFKN